MSFTQSKENPLDPQRCKICPFPTGTRCESEVPCIYNKHHTSDSKKFMKPQSQEEYIRSLNYDTR